ncbi:MAG: DNA polymerase III subunit gamma/tau, partial [Rikenellaceae bacterium]|nr:DNA polymerase III subunit gamma/tau [Rikenellaceae bacterium]
NNSVDDIRALTEQVRIPPQVGRYSVYIIDEVHMLTTAAFNAFLKTLEEPPAHAIFILATTEKHKIIPTILSRCQIYDFNRIRVEDAVDYLKQIADKEGVTYDEESLHIIAQKADGAMRDALSMFDKVVSFCDSKLDFRRVADVLNVLDYDTYFQIVDAAHQGDYPRLLLMFDEILRKGFGGQVFIAGLDEHYRNLLMARIPQTLPLLEVTGGVAKRYAEQAMKFEVPQIYEAISLLTAADSGFRSATNQRLFVELALLRLAGLGQKKNVDEPLLPAPVAREVVIDGGGVVLATAPQTQSAPVQVSAERSVSVNESAKPAPEANNVTKTVAVKSETVAAEPSRAGRSSRFSIRELMTAPTEDLLRKTVVAKKEVESEDVLPESDAGQDALPENIEEKIYEASQTLSESLMATRPRLAAVLQRVTVKGNTLCVDVPNDQLREEILFNKQELQRSFIRTMGCRVVVEFDVNVVVDNSFVKPVKLEEKVRYFSEKNPDFVEFCRRLKVDVE